MKTMLHPLFHTRLGRLFSGLMGLVLVLTLGLMMPSTQVFAAGGISGQVWNDMDSGTDQDVGEPGIRNVTMQLRAAGGDTIFGTGDDVLYPDQVTDNSGNYSFAGLPAGSYRLSVDFLSLPEGFDITTANEPMLITLATDQFFTGGNFGYHFSGKSHIGDYVWNDINANGDWDEAGEGLGVGIGGVALSLYLDMNDDGVFTPTLGNDLLLLQTTTFTTGVNTGKYDFPVAASGSTFFVLVDASNFLPGGPLAGYLFTNGQGAPYPDENPMFVPLARLASSYNIDFGYVQPATIGGTVYDDLSGNGSFNAGEPPITSGVVITLSNGLTTTTDVNGVYTFTNLLPGSYTVVEVNPPGYTSTGDKDGGAPDSIAVTVTQGQSILDNNFFDAKPTLIAGGVYDDLNGNGVQNGGEPPLSSVLITLSNGMTTTTNASGLYTFTVMPGTYTVTETNPINFTSTGAEAGNGAGTTSTVVNADRISVTTTSGSTSVANDFLDQKPVTITGTVWDDKNAISGLTAGDIGIAGVTITLTGTNGLGQAITLTAVTDPNGVYTFTNVSAGVYTLTETDKAGYTSTGDIVGANDNRIPLTVTSGTNVTGQDFFDTLPVTIGGGVYDDLNGNGVQNVGEPGLAGVTVTRTGGVTTTTDANGLYTFTVLAGTYSITETNPANYTSTGAEAGTTGSTVINTDRIDVTLTSGQTSLQNDFLDQKPVTITGTVWDDKNAISGLTAGDIGIAGVTITLTGTNGLGQAITLTAVTDPNGVYTFTNVSAGVYTLTETDKAGYTSTGDIVGANDNRIPLTVTSGTNVTGQDFFDTLPVTIGGGVYDDLNGNGVQNVGELGLAGVTVTRTGGVTTTTDANGLYTFTVLAGTYSITETNPANYTSTGAEAGTTGSTVINTDRIDVTLTSGQTSLQNDFLDTKPITLTGSVFSDPAGNGTGTTGLASVPITLTGTNGLGQPITLTTTTGPTGAYTFTNLLPGTYTLVETNPTGYKSTSDVQGSPTDDTIVVTVTSGTNVTNQNFWDQAPLASIGDFVWYDVDGDGVQDSGEPGVPGVGISLTLPSGVVVNTTTNSSGIYSFTGLPAGTYTVTVNTATLPADFALTVGAQSAVSPLTVVLTQTQTYTTADFGFDVPTSYLLSKVLTSANPARTGEVVEFRITVTNTGKSVLTVLPMTDTFNAQFLQYVTASAVPDFNLNGTMRWNDLTTAASVGDLLPNTSKFITVTFLALRDTYLSPGTVTTNTVTISNGLADPDGAGPLGNVEPLTPATSNANVRIDGPTAVLLSNSQVKNEDGMVSINWTTVSENNILGFNVQRWDSQGRMTLVNAQPIGAQLAGQAAGAGYTLLDLTADSQELAAGGYTYVLEVLTLDGGTTLVELGGVSTQYTLFLPLLTR